MEKNRSHLHIKLSNLDYKLLKELPFDVFKPIIICDEIPTVIIKKCVKIEINRPVYRSKKEVDELEKEGYVVNHLFRFKRIKSFSYINIIFALTNRNKYNEGFMWLGNKGIIKSDAGNDYYMQYEIPFSNICKEIKKDYIEKYNLSAYDFDFIPISVSSKLEHSDYHEETIVEPDSQHVSRYILVLFNDLFIKCELILKSGRNRSEFLKKFNGYHKPWSGSILFYKKCIKTIKKTKKEIFFV